MRVAKDSDSGEEITEDMWFARHKGLVRLEQKVDGQKSMTWELADFFERE